jgi:serine/threonine-protein kinase
VNDTWDRLDARLRAAIGAAAGELADSGAAHWQGRELGAYRIESRISAGGMGVVYRARRADEQFERLVAIKVMHGPLASDEARRRFFAERQILADLNHPNIAQLLDGGTTPEGVPYLVMEYIDGKPIDEYCREASVTLAQKLRLFIEACSAVQYAHQHLVVHRDIKASNILVTSGGVPKLLDFGIAKLLDGGERAKVATDLTLADARLLTPRNASPEQVRGTAITTASDIYSLGVLLYELLTARPPYTIQGTTSLELERAICGTEPAMPSRYDSQLAGDLDTIVLMALRKDPARRYATVRQFADDLERHLAHRPVLARPESWRYRAGKFLRRNALATAAVALVLLAVGSLVTFYTLQLQRERELLARERATAEEVSAFLVGLFEDADPTHALPDVSARQVLEEGTTRIEELRSSQPLVAARLMLAMGRAYSGLGVFDRARDLDLEALAIRRRLLPAGDPRIAEALHHVGVAQTELREHDASLATLREALKLREAALGPDAAPVGETLYRIGVLQHRRGDYVEMGKVLERVMVIYQTAYGANSPTLVDVLNMLGLHYGLVSNNASSIATLERALGIGEQAWGRDSIRIATTLNALGRQNWALGKFPEAIRHYQRALSIKERYLGLEHPELGTTLYGLANSSNYVGAFSDSFAYYSRSIAILRKALGPDDFYLAMSYSGMAFLHSELGLFDESREYFQRSLDIAERKWGPNHPDLRAPLAGLARAMMQQRQFAEAEVRLARALAIVEPQFPPEHVDVVRTLSSIATLNRWRGNYTLARKQFEEVLARFDRGVGRKHPFATEALFGMGEVLKYTGSLPEAGPYYQAAMQNFSGVAGERKPAAAECFEGYADYLRRVGKVAEADAMARKGAQVRAYIAAERAKVLAASRELPSPVQGAGLSTRSVNSTGSVMPAVDALTR